MLKEKTVSLCMIVKNEEATLSRSIESARDLIDEIIVVDTGSTDKTKEIAKKAGAKVFDFEWVDDFAKARNFSISKASCDWILVLDADELISKRDFFKLIRTMNEDQYDAIEFYQRNYFQDPGAENWCANTTDYEEGKEFLGYSDVPVIRLFKNIESIFYQGVVHESVDESLQAGRVHYSGFPIHHYRKDFKGKAFEEKQQRYLKLLLKAFEEDPNNVNTCFLLGRQFYDLGQYPEAVGLLKQAIELGSVSEMVHEHLALAYYQCTMYKEAVDVLETLIDFNPRYTEAFATLGISYYELGQVEESVNSLIKAINLKPTSVRNHFNLGAVFYKEGDFEAAETHLKEAIRLVPKFTRSYYLLFHVYLNLGRDADVVEIGRILKRLDSELFKNVEEHFLLAEKRVSVAQSQ